MEQQVSLETPPPFASVAEKVGAALILSRQITQLSADDYALQMTRLVGRPVSGGEVLASEATVHPPYADYLVAAGRIAGVGVGYLLKEWDYNEARVARIEGEIHDLQAIDTSAH